MTSKQAEINGMQTRFNYIFVIHNVGRGWVWFIFNDADFPCFITMKNDKTCRNEAHDYVSCARKE